MTRSTPKNLRPVPIGGVASLLNSPAPDAPAPDAPAPDDTVIVPPVDPVEGAQPEVMRFTAGEYADFGRALSRANLGNQSESIRISDFFRRDPESDDENPMYLYTGSPINFYGGYGEDEQGRSVKITSGKAFHPGGKRKGQPVSKEFVVNNFLRELAAIDESP